MAHQIDAVSNDLNHVISSAVQARIETEVATALAGSNLMVQYVTAALHQTVEVKDRNSYNTRKTTFMRETIDEAIREATKAAVRKVIASEQDKIEAAVTSELRRNIKSVSKKLAGKLAAAAKGPYGMTIEVKYPGQD